jgi:quercetin dioxygenase-like cupin family protein
MLTKILHTHNTFNDYRGSILTYIPDTPIVEFNIIDSKKDTIRGNHYHPEYDEYMIIVKGLATFTEYLDNDSKTIYTTPGTILHIPVNTLHSSKAITDYQFISLLTKKFDDCAYPIITIESKI